MSVTSMTDGELIFKQAHMAYFRWRGDRYTGTKGYLYMHVEQLKALTEFVGENFSVRKEERIAYQSAKIFGMEILTHNGDDAEIRVLTEFVGGV